MDIAHKFESHTVCLCRHAFRTDFSCKINSKSKFRESVDFQKKYHNFMIVKKCKKCSMDLGRYKCIKFLVVSDFEALFKWCNQGGHSGSMWIAFQWGLNLGCLTLRYMENNRVFL